MDTLCSLTMPNPSSTKFLHCSKLETTDAATVRDRNSQHLPIILCLLKFPLPSNTLKLCSSF